MDLYDSIVARTVERGGTAVALGGLDSGKTSFCKMCAAVAVRLGRTVAYVDSDVGQSAVGPPTTITNAPSPPGGYQPGGPQPGGVQPGGPQPGPFGGYQPGGPAQGGVPPGGPQAPPPPP